MKEMKKMKKIVRMMRKMKRIKVREFTKVKEVMTGDVSPVAMFL